MAGSRAVLMILATVFSAAAPGVRAAAIDDPLYAQLLERHTREVSDLARVRVDYAGLRDSTAWARLVASLERSEPSRLRTSSERVAFWVNAYNILAVNLVVEHYPVDSIKDIGSLFSPVWKKPAGTIAGRSYSLDEIEHGIVRPMGDPRTHVAVVCASLSCPPLLREPWRADRLDAQLDAQMRRWLADPRKGARIDRTTRTLALSRIFDWFEGDFEVAGGVTSFVAPYLAAPDRSWLRDRRESVEIEYLDYDWRLNDLAQSGPVRRGAPESAR